ncbi:hypothetical protein NDU88_009415 [Pleurodeles waltl]|uniref:WAP domain-containing protein n=1 Tax=Pleurodeles waltl TaxID=8319 RepID=A0AAV7NZ84_PLEWA|nr:hypothetical protein NDU88_009415 [Pleurodeles waltl]
MKAAGSILILAGLTLWAGAGSATPVGPRFDICPPDLQCMPQGPMLMPSLSHECFVRMDCSPNQMCCQTNCVRKCTSKWPGIPPFFPPQPDGPIVIPPDA